MNLPAPSAPILDDGWSLHELDVVPSTNLLAASLPPWNALRAALQTAGRGRFDRPWISNRGGLWLSAVLPAPSPDLIKVLPLLAGFAVCSRLLSIASIRPRLRWPNDVLIHDKKLAGILVEQTHPQRVIVGIGMNVFNQPETIDPALAKTSIRLADIAHPAPSLPDLARRLLRTLRAAFLRCQKLGFQDILPEINAFWDAPKPVVLDLDGDVRRGLFAGIDPRGQLMLANDLGGVTTFAPHQVRHLTELR